MTRELDLFYKLTNIKGLKSYKIKSGITNINYKIKTDIGEFVIRIPRKDIIGLNRKNEEKVISVVKAIKLNVDIIYFDSNTGIMISKYVKTKKRKHVSLKVINEHLKKLHSLSVLDIEEFNPFKLIDTYSKYCDEKTFINKEIIINQSQNLYKKYPLVLCHNDLLYANCINSNDKEYLIDYEYAGKNIALFDIASFISENNIENLTSIKRLLKMYYGKVSDEMIKDINTMCLLLDMLWAYWGYAMYNIYNQKIFLDIAISKHQRFNSKSCIY